METDQLVQRLVTSAVAWTLGILAEKAFACEKFIQVGPKTHGDLGTILQHAT